MKKFLRFKVLFFLMIVLAVGMLVVGCGGREAGKVSADNSQSSGQSSDAAKESKYPERSIEAVVGWGAGGGTDTFTRAITKPASEILGVPFVVVNKPGASGSIAGDYVARQPADGYTIWAISSNYPLNVALGKTPHGLDKYIPVARLQHDTATIQIAADGPFKDINELVEAAKANPGKVTIGGTGAMGFDEIVIAMWEKAAGIDLNYVPYDKAGKMHSALLGGHIDAMFEEFGPTIGMIKEGKIKVVLAFTDKRLEDFPDVPVAPEFGWDVTEGQSRGILVPAGTPEEVVKTLESAFKQAKESESYKSYERDKYLHLREGWLGSEDFKAQLEQAIEKYKGILKEIQG